MRLSIIIPNYNGEELLRKNLPKVLEAVSSMDAEIIITDDASVDLSERVVRQFMLKDKRIKFLTCPENTGFSSNVNRGIGQASGEILILLNTDVSPNKDFLGPLLKHFSDEKVFAVGCMDESVEGEKTVKRGRGIGSWNKGLLVHKRGEIDSSDTLWVSGGSGAFRKSIWEKLSGLDPLYNPFYWEDIDLSYRALKSGYRLVFEKESIVRHEHEKGIIKSRYNATEVKKIAYKNQFIFAWKNADSRNLFLNIFWLPYYIISSVLSRDFSLVLGIALAFSHLPGILMSRNKARKLFIISDREVTEQMR